MTNIQNCKDDSHL